jgi:hypothetical protein
LGSSKRADHSAKRRTEARGELQWRNYHPTVVVLSEDNAIARAA